MRFHRVLLCALHLRASAIQFILPSDASSSETTATATATDKQMSLQQALTTTATAATMRLWASDDVTAFGSTAHVGAKPHAVVGVGFQKCGGTVANKIMSLHPDAFSSDVKETSFFNDPSNNECRRLSWNETHVNPYKKYLKACFGGIQPGQGQATIEFTGSYAVNIQSGNVAANFKRVGQHVSLRFLALVRDPRERIISYYNMKRKRAKTDATDSELCNMIGDDVRNAKNGTISEAISKGMYAQHLKNFLLDLSKEQLLVVNMRRLGEVRTLDRVFDHIGLRPLPKYKMLEMLGEANSWYDAQQQGMYEKRGVSYLNCSDHLLQELSEFYDPHDQKLWELLGTQWWWPTTNKIGGANVLKESARASARASHPHQHQQHHDEIHGLMTPCERRQMVAAAEKYHWMIGG